MKNRSTSQRYDEDMLFLNILSDYIFSVAGRSSRRRLKTSHVRSKWRHLAIRTRPNEQSFTNRLMLRSVHSKWHTLGRSIVVVSSGSKAPKKRPSCSIKNKKTRCTIIFNAYPTFQIHHTIRLRHIISSCSTLELK